MNRRFPLLSFFLAVLVIFTVSSVMAQTSFRTKTSSFGSKSSGGNLVVNGDCEDPENPLKGWHWDYDWNLLSQNAGNKAELVKSASGRRNVCKLLHRAKKESPIVSPLADFEFGKVYTISCDIKADKGSGHRLYVKGFKWKSGVRPYENPHLGDLTLIYKGKNLGGVKTSWKRITTQFPMLDYDEMSPLSKKNLKYVRKIGLYAIMTVGASRDGGIYFDNLVIKEKK